MTKDEDVSERFLPLLKSRVSIAYENLEKFFSEETVKPINALLKRFDKNDEKDDKRSCCVFVSPLLL